MIRFEPTTMGRGDATTVENHDIPFSRHQSLHQSAQFLAIILFQQSKSHFVQKGFLRKTIAFLLQDDFYYFYYL